MCITINKQYLYLLPIVSGGSLSRNHLAVDNLERFPGNYCGTTLALQKRKEKKKKQILVNLWIIPAEENWSNCC